MSKKILFIGGINRGRNPRGGAEAKNQILLKKLTMDYGNLVYNLDVSRYRNNLIFMFLWILWSVIKYEKIVISVPSPSLKRLSFLNPILKRREVVVFIIGGIIHKKLENQRLNKLLENSLSVYAETKFMVSEIKKKNPNINAKYLPNFKFIPVIPPKQKNLRHVKEIRFLYLSIINKEKGIFRSIQIINALNRLNNHIVFTLDIYGVIDEDIKLEFNKTLLNNDKLKYSGFIDLNKEEGYLILSEYDFMFFLTNHEGEGFPGVLIDAMIAQVPIIASNWNHNREILNTDKGSIGVIVELDEDIVSNTVDAILDLINDPKEYQNMRDLMRLEVDKYNIGATDLLLFNG